MLYSSESSEEEFNCYDVVDSLQQKKKPIFTSEECKLMHTYTYDKEPVKEWRQVNDYEAIKECNRVKWKEISKLVGDCPGFENSGSLYRSKEAKIVNVIERIICKKGCYYFPEKCFMDHGYNFKSLLMRSLHEEFNPHFKKIFEGCESRDVTLELTHYGAPNMLKLAEDINFNTALVYDEEGMLKVDISVLTEESWIHKRPSFVKEEKKVLDMIHGLLICALKKRDAEISLAALTYSQTCQGLNDPVLKVMCCGPDYGEKEYSVDDCDISKDEKKIKHTNLTSVEHIDCKSFKQQNHWEYKHHMTECVGKEVSNLAGPVSNMKSEVFYPCNLQHCWVCCKCKFCKLLRVKNCKEHKQHARNNTKECVIQKEAQCQEHWIDHPDNFMAGDIEIEKNLLFHNNKVKIYGRNYHTASVKYSGLKRVCKKCKKNTLDHLNNHLTPHLQCKHCLYELKTVEDKLYWRKACNICGKVFSSEPLKIRHVRRHDFPRQECDICRTTFSSKFNLHRHMVEQHNAMQQVHGDPGLKCLKCQKLFLSKGKLGRHVQGVHRQMLSQQEVQHNFSKEQANTNVQKPKEIAYNCNSCEKVFYQESNSGRASKHAPRRKQTKV